MRKEAFLSLGICLFVLGCLHAPDPGTQVPAALGYTLKPGDILSVEIAGDADISRQYPIEEDGTVALALIGSIPAAGSTVASFQEELQKRLVADHFKNPVVTASLVASAPLDSAQWSSPPLRQSELSPDNSSTSAVIPELRITSVQ